MLEWLQINTFALSKYKAMITDSSTNTLYLAQGIRCYKLFYSNLLSALEENKIKTLFLPHTNSKKHIWARDYMPIQLEKERFLHYQYKPDYLSGYKGYIPNVDAIISDLELNCIQTDVILDGGNVIKCGDKVIMTDKIFKENQNYSKNKLITKLEELFQAQLITIPWDKYEIFGHADGMVRYIKGNKILLNNYAEFDKGFRKLMLKALLPHFEVVELNYQSKQCHKYSWAYLNFLRIGDSIFVPKLNIPEDTLAAEQIKSHYPNCKIILIDGAEQLVRNGGALNCISWNI